MKENKIKPEDAARILGVSVQTIRVGLQQKYFPFGWAIKTSPRRYTYAISPKLFEEYLGTKCASPTSEEVATFGVHLHEIR